MTEAIVTQRVITWATTALGSIGPNDYAQADLDLFCDTDSMARERILPLSLELFEAVLADAAPDPRTSYAALDIPLESAEVVVGATTAEQLLAHIEYPGVLAGRSLPGLVVRRTNPPEWPLTSTRRYERVALPFARDFARLVSAERVVIEDEHGDRWAWLSLRAFFAQLPEESLFSWPWEQKPDDWVAP